LNTELGVLGDELQTAQDLVEELIERYERMRARLGMRELRSERAAAKDGEDPLEAKLRLAASSVARSNPLPPWPEAM